MNFSRLDKKIRGRDLSDFVLFQIALFVFCINPIVQFAHLIIRPYAQCQANACTCGAVFEISPISNRFAHKVLNSFHHSDFSFQCKPSYLHKGRCIFRVRTKRKEPTISRKLFFRDSPVKLCISGLSDIRLKYQSFGRNAEHNSHTTMVTIAITIAVMIICPTVIE